MRVALDWLGEFIPLPSDEELVHRLDMVGFEDAAIETDAPDLSTVVVGHVTERAQHPDADRLSVCRVDLGDGEPVEIVCGAPNVDAGQKVAVAPVGTKLPDGTKLKKSKIRGVVSNGMICSKSELGLGEDHDGIWVLDGDAPVGVALPDAVTLGARTLEVGITPNRGDTASLLGLAREVRAVFGGELTLPETTSAESGAAADDAISVEIEAPSDCHTYVARVVRGVRVGPSPAWVVARLEASGIRSINNVVDVTNLVLLELGQPLHAFDLQKLRGATVRVRRALEGEALATLDGEKRTLTSDDLVIADAEVPIALAGVMGGADTEVGDATRDVLIESANFRPTGVRLTARRYGLHSEASYRFERGVDREGQRRAADRAARLLEELAGGTVAPGAVRADGDPASATPEVELSIARANRLLGMSFTADDCTALLERVGVVARETSPGVLTAEIPSHRNDLHVHQDLAEEVARIYGYDRIPTTEPVATLGQVELPPRWALADRARDALVAAGLQEIMTLPFVRDAEVAALRLPEGDRRRVAVRLANPIHDDEAGLRTSLLPSLLRVVQQNRNRQLEGVRIFEVASVFLAGDAVAPSERQEAVGVLAGSAEGLWAGSAPIFFEAKGVAERLLFQAGYVPSYGREGIPPYLHPGAAASISVDGTRVGAIGELHPEVAAGFEIEGPCAAIEVDLDALIGCPGREIRPEPTSRHPRVRRDVAVVIDRTVPAGDVSQAIVKAAGNDCTSAELFDRYEGRGVPEGRVSLGFRLVFQRADRTLKDTEVTKAVDRVVKMLSHRFGAELR